MRDALTVRNELDRLRAAGLSQRDYERLSAAEPSITEQQLRGGLVMPVKLSLDEGAVNEKERTVQVAFIDESIIPRWWGNLIVEQSEAAARLGRLNNGAAVLLYHDDFGDPLNHVGVVVRAWLGRDKVSRAILRFGRSERAELVFRDVVDGIRTKISMGFILHKIVLVEESEDGPSLYRCTDWEPYELSFVPVPAVDSVGVGLAFNTQAAGANAASTPPEGADMPETIVTSASADEVRLANEAGAQAERERVNRITAIGNRFQMRELADEFIQGGRSAEDFRNEVLLKLGDRAPLKPVKESANIGLTDREVNRFSIIRLANWMAEMGDANLAEAAMFEREVCAAAATRYRKSNDVGRFTLPQDVLHSAARTERLTSVNASDGASGGYLIAQSKGGLIELLREEYVLGELGVRFMGDLVGDVAFPKQTGGATCYWVGDEEDLTDSALTFGELELRARTVGTRVPISRQMRKQPSQDVEALVRDDAFAQIASGIQIDMINGAGGGKRILGLLKTTGIGSVAGGTDGAAPTYAHMVQLEGKVAIGKALRGRLAFLTNNKVRSQLRQTAESATMAAAGWVWKSMPGGRGEIIGYPAIATGDVPSTLVKGSSGAVCSAILFGAFDQVLVGLWGGLDLEIDKSTNIKSGGIVIQLMQDVDGGIRQPAAIAAMQDALTASA